MCHLASDPAHDLAGDLLRLALDKIDLTEVDDDVGQLKESGIRVLQLPLIGVDFEPVEPCEKVGRRGRKLRISCDVRASDMLKGDLRVFRQGSLFFSRCNLLKKSGQNRIKTRIRHEGQPRAAVSEIFIMQQHPGHYCAKFYGRWLFRRSSCLFLRDAEELTEGPWTPRRLATLDLVKNITSRRITGLDYVVVVPVAVHTDIFQSVNEKVQRVIFPPSLGARTFSWLDLTEPHSPNRHSRILMYIS